MATPKDNKMSLRMKGAFGKMKSKKFTMSKPQTKSQSSKQLKNMFNRFNKKTDGEQKWSSILSGTWDIELPIAEFLNAEAPSASDKKDNQTSSSINDPNSVSNQQCPMVQIYENLKVCSIPLSTDIAHPDIHQKYLSSKHISTNSTRLKLSKEKDNKILLINYKTKKKEDTEDKTDDIILDGTIDITSYSIRWCDGASWSKHGVHKKEDDDDMQTDTPSMTETDTMTNSQEMKDLRLQLEILKEKEQMAKMTTQAMMGQLADLGQQYAKITTEHENLGKEHEELESDHDRMKIEYDEMKETLKKNNEELNKVRGDMVFEKQQQIQTKLTKYKKENEEYAQSIKLQQERILSLQDQLQSSHIATRQYTKTIEDLEAKIGVIDKDKLETKAVLNEMNNKFVTSQTNLDDAKHKEMLITARHMKEIETLCIKHRQEIDKLERGFQETLRQNERKMQELQTLRNNYEKKNASLTKDVKRLIIQVEKQTKSFKSNSVTKSITFSNINDETEAIKKLRDENAQLSQELMRKSQSLVNALRALAEFHQNPENITKSITENLSHAKQYMHNDNGFVANARHNAEQTPASYIQVSDQLKVSMEQNMNEASTEANAAPVFGAQYGPNDLPPSATKLKFNRFRSKVGNRMKQQITKYKQNMVKDQLQRMKTSEDETLNELNARSVIKETEKVIITKTKQQLNSQCAELQGLANELSSTIEQKEVILESLRFANTYLGLRVIALERLMKMDPGTEIKNQDELIKDALNICSDELDNIHEDDRDENDDEKVYTENINKNEDKSREIEAKTEEIEVQKVDEDHVDAVELDIVSAGDNNYDDDSEEHEAKEKEIENENEAIQQQVESERVKNKRSEDEINVDENEANTNREESNDATEDIVTQNNDNEEELNEGNDCVNID